MHTLTGKVEYVEFFDRSKNGNSRWTAYIGGVKVYTGVDSDLGEDLKNYQGKNVSVTVHMIHGKLTIYGYLEVLPEHPDAAFIHGEFVLIYSDMNMSYAPKLRIHGSGWATKHMNVTYAQLRAIEAIMCDPVLANE